MKLSLVFLVLSLCFVSNNSYKILGIFPFGNSKSHYVIGEAVMRALNEAGHEITMVSVFEIDKPPPPNYRQITIQNLGETLPKGLLV